MIDPAVESVPLIFGLVVRFTAVGQIASYIIIECVVPDRIYNLLSLLPDDLDGGVVFIPRCLVLQFRLTLRGRKFFADRRIREKGLERVIILLRELIRFVIVTPSAGDRGAQYRRTDCVSNIGRDLMFFLHQIA